MKIKSFYLTSAVLAAALLSACSAEIVSIPDDSIPIKLSLSQSGLDFNSSITIQSYTIRIDCAGGATSILSSQNSSFTIQRRGSDNCTVNIQNITLNDALAGQLSLSIAEFPSTLNGANSPGQGTGTHILTNSAPTPTRAIFTYASDAYLPRNIYDVPMGQSANLHLNVVFVVRPGQGNPVAAGAPVASNYVIDPGAAQPAVLYQVVYSQNPNFVEIQVATVGSATYVRADDPQWTPGQFCPSSQTFVYSITDNGGNLNFGPIWSGTVTSSAQVGVPTMYNTNAVNVKIGCQNTTTKVISYYEQNYAL
jgi:hypothetical protein